MKKIIMDMDVGVDDGMAIAYAVASSDIELLGIVGTYGNVKAQESVQNARNLLHACGADNVGVYLGSCKPQEKEVFTRLEVSARIHGENGVGDVDFETAPITGEAGCGIDFMIESIEKYNGELAIVTTGPLTDLAQIWNRRPDVLAKISEVIIMGGALTVPGNIRQIAEANISQDPEAAQQIFESGIPIRMVGLDVTMRSLLTKAETQAWRDLNTDVGEKYAQMVDYYIDHVKAKGGCYMHDPSAVAMAAHPEWFDTQMFYLTVIREGDQRGRTVADVEKLQESAPNVKVSLQVDSGKFLNDFQTSLLSLFAGNCPKNRDSRDVV